MGVSFTWEVVKQVQENSFAHGSSLNSAIENAFGGLPRIFTENDIPKLEGISACGHPDIEDLIAAILEHGKVRVKSHW